MSNRQQPTRKTATSRRKSTAGSAPSGARARARAETQKEAQGSVVAPQAGVLYTEESAKGFLVGVPLFALLGALFALPFGLIEFGAVGQGTRMVIAAIVGAVAGGIIGAIAGPSVATRRKAKKDAGAPSGTKGRPGKAEVAEATGGHEQDEPTNDATGRRRTIR